RRLRWEVRALRAAGCSVRGFVPSATDLDAMGHNVMDPRRRRRVFETAVLSTTARLRAHLGDGAVTVEKPRDAHAH
ncbi:MAG: hypothetical protein ACTHK4_11750, partial [Mycobacteriales bacterium]